MKWNSHSQLVHVNSTDVKNDGLLSKHYSKTLDYVTNCNFIPRIGGPFITVVTRVRCDQFYCSPNHLASQLGSHDPLVEFFCPFLCWHGQWQVLWSVNDEYHLRATLQQHSCKFPSDLIPCVLSDPSSLCVPAFYIRNILVCFTHSHVHYIWRDHFLVALFAVDPIWCLHTL